MVFRELDKEERKEYMEFVNDYKEKILNRIGYVLPNKWVEYMSVEDLIGCADSSDVDFCCACFSGDYPIGKPEEEFFDKYSRKIQR